MKPTPTLTSSSSSTTGRRSSTFSNTSNIGSSTSSTSAASHQSSDRPSSSDNGQLSTCDSTSDAGRQHVAGRDISSQVAIKRFIFGDYNIDWKAIPTLDDDVALNHATLLYRQDLRCKASRDYYMEILNGFRVSTATSSPDPTTNTVIIDGEEVVDMIG